ncbi:hypothetical protein GW17_00053838 [Ensete ventricosum]|nr:hypothetical protein GW17_00053838 [Ensete ventricosum]
MIGAIELQPNDGPRSSLGIGLGSDNAVGSRREFARRFIEGIGKLVGNMKGDHWKKTGGLATRMSKATRLAEVVSKLRWTLNRPYHKMQVAASD